MSMFSFIVGGLILGGAAFNANAASEVTLKKSIRTGEKSMKALIVVTSHSKLGNTGKQTGYYLPEVSHPFFELKENGIDVEIASMEAGEAPMDPKSNDLDDPKNKKFMEQYGELLKTTKVLKTLNPKDYQAIIFAGGHGAMWDFSVASEVSSMSAGIYENGGVVAAVCHGPAALTNIRLSNGKPLVYGKKLTGFSNDEEIAAEMTKVMPFLLQDKLIELGAQFSHKGLWQENVVVDGRLITGQNPASGSLLGKKVAEVLRQK